MQRLQSLFNRLVGIHHNEAQLRARAHAIFSRAPLYSATMDVPAYLRRPPRVR